jgi:hypothetical protein
MVLPAVGRGRSRPAPAPPSNYGAPGRGRGRPASATSPLLLLLSRCHGLDDLTSLPAHRPCCRLRRPYPGPHLRRCIAGVAWLSCLLDRWAVAHRIPADVTEAPLPLLALQLLI